MDVRESLILENHSQVVGMHEIYAVQSEPSQKG